MRTLQSHFFLLCFSLNLIFSLPRTPLPSLFLPSRPPPTPACCLHPRLPRAALIHQRTPPLICRLHPRPTPTLVRPLPNFMSVCSRWLLAEVMNNWESTAEQKCLCLSVSPSSGLISPGVSVPVQVPGSEQQGMSHNLGQYWARLQWTTEKRGRNGGVGGGGVRGWWGNETKNSVKMAHRFERKHRTKLWRGASESCRPPKMHYMFTKPAKSSFGCTWKYFWSYCYLLSTIRLHLVMDKCTGLFSSEVE